MSAIFGLCRWDGGGADPESLATMGRALEGRGHPSPEVWQRGPAGLGQCLLATTPEASANRAAKAPWHWAEAGAVITADARLDERETLASALGLSAEAARAATDAELILRAYAKWGEACPEKLLGDFAFAIWDERKQTLFCARDHFGIRPFFYCADDASYAFASDFAALLALPQVPGDVNRKRIAEFLGGIAEDNEESYFAHVRKLRPGHAASIRREDARTFRYYQLTVGPELRLPGDAAYAGAFRDLFTQAVRRRARTPGAVGCMLSGGLDSSAIASVAGQLRRENACGPVSTFSNVYPTFPECDESAYIQSVLDQGGYDARLIPVDAARSWRDLEETITRVGEPTYGQGLFSSGDLYDEVRAAGLNAVLDGHGGDEVLSEGNAHLRELAEHNRWIELAWETMLLAKVHRVPFLPPYLRMVTTYGLAGRIRRGLRLRTRLRDAKAGSAQAAAAPIPKWAAFIHPKFFAEQRLRERRLAWRESQPDAVNDVRTAHLRRMANTAQAAHFEQLHRVAAARGVEPRYPFWDKDLVEFCLRLPTRQKLRRGWIKYVMREGLRGILPDLIRRRRDKMDFSAQSATALRSLGEQPLRELLAESTLGQQVIDAAWYENAVTRLFQQEASRDMNLPYLWRCISLLTWAKIAAQKK